MTWDQRCEDCGKHLLVYGRNPNPPVCSKCMSRRRETGVGRPRSKVQKPGMGGLVPPPPSKVEPGPHVDGAAGRGPRPRAYGVAHKTVDIIVLTEKAIEEGGSKLWHTGKGVMGSSSPSVK